MFSESLRQDLSNICNFFEAALQKNKLAHAYLCCGSNETLKENFAKELMQILNCKTKKACGICKNCLWIHENSHPELPIILEPDLEKSKKGVILVKQVQELLRKLQNKSPFYRVILIKKAEIENLTPESANSLLKTIEEPNAHTLFLLYAKDAQAVLPTIVSRCQIINFPNTQINIVSEEAQIIFDNLNSNKLNWFEISKLAEQINQADLINFLDCLLQIYIEKKQDLNKLELIEKTKNRLKYFCAPKPALEELLWNLRKN
jgi:DNA polymerase III delta prime subunit